MTNYFYGRCSTDNQSLDRQTDLAESLGILEENRYFDKANGHLEHRAALDELLAVLEENAGTPQTVFIIELSRLARSTKQLLELSEKFNRWGVDLVSQHEAIDTTTPCGKFYFTVLAGLVEMDKALILERTAEGRRAKIARDGKCGGRQRTNQAKLDTAIELYLGGNMSMREICETVGVSRSVIYKEIKVRGIERVK